MLVTIGTLEKIVRDLDSGFYLVEEVLRMGQKKILAFVIEENSKIKCNAEDGSCKLLGLFGNKAEADKVSGKI